MADPKYVTIPTVDEAPTVPLELAARAVGIKSRNTAYRAAERGDLPFRTLLIGGQGRRVVPTAELRRALGLDPAPELAQVDAVIGGSGKRHPRAV